MIDDMGLLQCNIILTKYFSLCVLGKRVLKDIPIENCTKEDPWLYDQYCPDHKCEEYFQSTLFNKLI